MDRQKRPGVNPPGGLHLKKCKPPGGFSPQKGVNPPGGFHPKKEEIPMKNMAKVQNF